MDLHVERQCVDQMKEGNLQQILLLFDAYFSDLYRYVARRVSESVEVERIVRLTFIEALDKVQDTPGDVSYLVWLYSLAKPRVWSAINKSSHPEKQGLINASEKAEEKMGDTLAQVEKMLKKLSLEEREILKLKFFEEVSDGDVVTVLGVEEEAVGPKIYRVLKRAHFLMFGESDERQGVYFGELSGLFERVRKSEIIEVPEVLKLSLRADLVQKIDRRGHAIPGEEVKEEKKQPEASPFAKEQTGSDDPAKIFVNAVKEIRDSGENVEDYYPTYNEEEVDTAAEDKEWVMEFFDRWKFVLALIPAILFVAIVAFVAFKLVDFNEGRRVVRGYPTTCSVEVEFEGDFFDALKRSVNMGISDRICDHFEDVQNLRIAKVDDGRMSVSVGLSELLLDYSFAKKNQDWRIKRYAKTFNSDQEPGKVYRD